MQITKPIIWGDTDSYTLTLKGNGHTLTGNNTKFIIIQDKNTLNLENLTIQNFTTGYNYDFKSLGGGAINNEGTLNIKHVNFIQNKDIYAGAIYNIGTTTITHSNFKSNNALYGGSIANEGVLILNDTNFTGNYAEADGGCLYNEGYLKITNSTCKNNTAIEKGGVTINLPYATVEIINTTFTQNTAINGGCNYYAATKTTIINTTYTNNTARNGAVEYIENLSVIKVQNSLYQYNQVVENLTPTIKQDLKTDEDNPFEEDDPQNPYEYDIYGDGGYAGAIYIGDLGNITITNSTFNNNNALYGGAIYNTQYLSVKNSEFNYNFAQIEGGAIYLEGQSKDNMTIKLPDYNIIENNTFTNNEVYSNGGAIYDEYARGKITNNTFTYNKPDTIYTQFDNTYLIVENNTIEEYEIIWGGSSSRPMD